MTPVANIENILNARQFGVSETFALLPYEPTDSMLTYARERTARRLAEAILQDPALFKMEYETVARVDYLHIDARLVVLTPEELRAVQEASFQAGTLHVR